LNLNIDKKVFVNYLDRVWENRFYRAGTRLASRRSLLRESRRMLDALADSVAAEKAIQAETMINHAILG